MTESIELLSKLALSGIGLVLLLRRRLQGGDRRDADPALTIIAVIALASFFNFGTFQYGSKSFVHLAEMFHYQLGAKYFPELGYDGLYEASIVAQSESHPDLPPPRRVRDLRTNAITTSAEVLSRRSEIVDRFSPARWKSFVSDHAYFCRAVTDDLPDTRIDHGYNPTPTWTFVARLFNGWLPIDFVLLHATVLLDWILIGVTIAIVLQVYGRAVAATFVILLGVGYPWRYLWTGGAFLRFDWFAAMVTAIAMLKRERFAAGGALLAYATAVRIFPGLLLVGVGVVAIRTLIRRESVQWIFEFCKGFLVVSALCVIAGSMVGRGFAAWSEFARNLRKHHDTWSINQVGLELPILYDSNLSSPKAGYWANIEPLASGGFELIVPELGIRAQSETLESAHALFEDSITRFMQAWQEAMTREHERRRPLYFLAIVVAIVLVALASWGATIDEAATIGLVAIFSLVSLSSYYLVFLVLAALRRDSFGALGLLILNILTIAAVFTLPLNIYLAYSVGTALFLTVWIAPDALATIRNR